MKRTRLSSDELKALRAVPVSVDKPNRVRAACGILGLSQSDIVAGTQLSRPTVSDIYNFQVSDVKYTTLRALADFFGCAIDDLFPAVGDAPSADQLALPLKRKAAIA